jgi:hypothetical protein
VEVPEGGDVMRSYRKKQVLKKLQRERDDNRFMGVRRK